MRMEAGEQPQELSTSCFEANVSYWPGVLLFVQAGWPGTLHDFSFHLGSGDGTEVLMFAD